MGPFLVTRQEKGYFGSIFGDQAGKSYTIILKQKITKFYKSDRGTFVHMFKHNTKTETSVKTFDYFHLLTRIFQMLKFKVSNYTLSFWPIHVQQRNHLINLIWCGTAKNISRLSHTKEHCTSCTSK